MSVPVILSQYDGRDAIYYTMTRGRPGKLVSVRYSKEAKVFACMTCPDSTGCAHALAAKAGASVRPPTEAAS